MLENSQYVLFVSYQPYTDTELCCIFSGLCLERPGCQCVPKKTRQVKVDIVVGVNSSSTSLVCSSIEIEEHRGPCKCKCLTKSCHYNMVFDRDACMCRCKDSFAVLKRDCLTRPIGGEIVNFWDEETCTCKCKPRTCVEGHYQASNFHLLPDGMILTYILMLRPQLLYRTLALRA